MAVVGHDVKKSFLPSPRPGHHLRDGAVLRARHLHGRHAPVSVYFLFLFLFSGLVGFNTHFRDGLGIENRSLGPQRPWGSAGNTGRCDMWGGTLGLEHKGRRYFQRLALCVWDTRRPWWEQGGGNRGPHIGSNCSFVMQDQGLT